MRRPLLARAAMTAGVLVLAGCSLSSGSGPSPVAASPPAFTGTDLREAWDALLPTSVLPRLTADHRTLDAQDLADEAGDPAVAVRLTEAGFLGGAERTFRGRSRTLTGAESRVLVFDGAEGASTFAAYLADHPDPFFGGPSLVTPLQVGEAAGAMIEPPLCDCPGAYPLYVGILTDGERVLWLQLTGPEADPQQLRLALAAMTDD